MKFENVSILTENIMDIIKEMRYCWVDDSGMICDQRGVFRVNCLDCLDRTNVVQSAIARIVLEVQCRKLGLLPPDADLPGRCRHLIQQMWANNGDSISRQYAGTAALKGDYTRTGERKISGMMKDGVNSASRYYIQRVRDVYRQATVDLVLGRHGTEDQRRLLASAAVGPAPQEPAAGSEEDMKTLIDECKKMLISEPETCLGGWGLVDCDPATGDPTQIDMDTILLLTQRAYYVANYDDELDMVTRYQKIYLEDLTHMEIGPAASLFKSKHVVLRVHYTVDEEAGFFHSLRATNTRLFNNMLVHINNDDDATEMLRGIYESFLAAKKFVSQELPLIEGKLDRRRSKRHGSVIDIASQAQELMDAAVPRLDPGSSHGTPRPSTSRQAREAITNLGRTFAGLNPVKKIRFSRLRPPQGLMPATWYTKLGGAGGDTAEAVVVSTGRQDDADVSVDVAESRAVAGKEEEEEESSEGEVELETAGGEDGHMFLESCGLLNATTRQLVHALLPPADTDTTPYTLPVAAAGAKSLVTGDKVFRRFNSFPTTAASGIKTTQSATKKKPAFFIASSPPVAADDDALSETKLAVPVARRVSRSADDVSSPATETDVAARRSTAASERDIATATERDIAVTVSTATEWEERPPTSQPSTDETWVNVSVTAPGSWRGVAGAGLHHPMMKTSLSEGSSLVHAAGTGTADMEEVAVAPGDLAAISPFSRLLRVKMPGLAGSPGSPGGPLPAAAAQNRRLAEARYRHCNTTVILL